MQFLPQSDASCGSERRVCAVRGGWMHRTSCPGDVAKGAACDFTSERDASDGHATALVMEIRQLGRKQEQIVVVGMSRTSHYGSACECLWVSGQGTVWNSAGSDLKPRRDTKVPISV